MIKAGNNERGRQRARQTTRGRTRQSTSKATGQATRLDDKSYQKPHTKPFEELFKEPFECVQDKGGHDEVPRQEPHEGDQDKEPSEELYKETYKQPCGVVQDEVIQDNNNDFVQDEGNHNEVVLGEVV